MDNHRISSGRAAYTGACYPAHGLKGRRFRKEKEPNYRVFFFIGISWLGIGTVFTIIYAATDLPFFMGIPFIGIGVTCVAIGLDNRDKWTQV